MHTHPDRVHPNRLLAIGVVINLLFAAVEAGIGIWQGSLALVADAGHNVSDVFGLALAWVGLLLGRTKPTRERTYGLRKGSILAALGSSLLIVVAMAIIAWEALKRFQNPVVPPGETIMIVAAVGVAVNAATALLLAKRRSEDLNLKGAFLHMVADAAISAGVVAAGLAVLLTGWTWIDPAVSIVIAGVIIAGTWDLIKESLNLAVDGVPREVNIREIKDFLKGLPGVKGVHDLHVWGLSTTQSVLTAHISVESDEDQDQVLKSASEGLSSEFGLGHTTLQIEQNAPCPTDEAGKP